MIADNLIIYLLFMLILLIVNLIGYLKVRILMIIGLLSTLIMAIPTIIGFGDYYMFGFVLVLINSVLPVMGILTLANSE